jgi:DNA-binding transcriptional regulator YiaG
LFSRTTTASAASRRQTEIKETDMSMKEPSPRRRVKFNGTFTEEVRRLIKRKREELGLPYLAIAEYFKINWSTFRKWESGETVNCGLRHRPIVEAFINGDLDDELRSLYASNSNKYSASTPSKVYQAMERVANTYTLCARDPDIGENMLTKIEQIAMDTLKHLVNASRNRQRQTYYGPQRGRKPREK